MKKVLFWDFDGTLSYPNKRFETALYETLTTLGFSVDRSLAMAFMANAYPWKHPEEDHRNEIGMQWWQGLFAKIDAFCTDLAIGTLQFPAIREKLKCLLTDVENYRLYEDAVQTLRLCAEKGYQNYLLTNNYPEILENVEKLGIYPYFSGFVVSGNVGYDKPRKELYAYAKALAGEPDICYMIGDNPVADIGGGRSAGMQTIFVHNGLLENADYCVETLCQIPDILF